MGNIRAFRLSATAIPQANRGRRLDCGDGKDREEAGELERNYERERLQKKGSDVESGCSLTNNDRFQGMLESMVWPISSCTEDEQMHFSHYSMTEWVS